MSQAELAEKINTKQHAISRIEKGAFNVGFDTLQSIAEIFGMNILPSGLIIFWVPLSGNEMFMLCPLL
ncbi:helix-turn-helix domain-containing protein [Parabacteroides goldsteinii]|uniref:helix-turn-helix domain-containing protein n=1 Tax=Parabacteroides goldsteinii TaxID=328812 RepID=UPI0025B12270|nr:helix-turn-helix transcriptional regulator [Parabacteroides goldsteinii]